MFAFMWYRRFDKWLIAEFDPSGIYRDSNNDIDMTDDYTVVKTNMSKEELIRLMGCITENNMADTMSGVYRIAIASIFDDVIMF
jgi:hypothetical protein